MKKEAKFMDGHLQDAIARVAYELYVKGGCLQGRDLEYWCEAERIVAKGHASAPPAAEPREKGNGREPKGRRSVQKPSKGSRKPAKARA
jgi:hypothetical protein